MIFRDRTDAGRRLALELSRYKDERPLVVGLPRGGVPVAYEVARALGAPLDVFVVRKLGAPSQPEFGLGALAEDGTIWVNQTAARLGVRAPMLAELAARERAEAERRVRRFRGGRPFPEISGRTVILVDDGIATGGTVHAAVRALRARRPARLVLAVPVSAPDAAEGLRAKVDDFVCLTTPGELWAIGQAYRDFEQVSDDDVVWWLDRARQEVPASAVAPEDRGSERAAPAEHARRTREQRRGGP